MIEPEHKPFLIFWFICGAIAIFGTLRSKGILGKKAIKLTLMALVGIGCFLALVLWLDGIWAFILALVIVSILKDENLKEVYNKIFQEKNFTHDIVIEFAIMSFVRFIGLIIVMYLANSQLFSVRINKMENQFQTHLDTITQPLGKPNKTSSKTSSLFYLEYDYNNPNPKALELLTKNIKSQKKWKAVAKENMQYPESNIAEYCNKEITLMVSKYEGGLSVKTRWSRSSFCHKSYGSPWFVPTTD